MKVLLVDDSSTMRRIQTNQLNGLGVSDIVEAENGQDGLDKLAKSMPLDVVLLDWNMPVKNGFEFLTEARANAAYKDVKIIMCTSESEKTRVLEALKAGANNYIVKPFTPESLKEKLGL
ncbi:MAG: response regulator [Chitinivibrionia bacterium]|nr:response regulator [Chitinivibrionia bacterium]